MLVDAFIHETISPERRGYLKSASTAFISVLLWSRNIQVTVSQYCYELGQSPRDVMSLLIGYFVSVPKKNSHDNFLNRMHVSCRHKRWDKMPYTLNLPYYQWGYYVLSSQHCINSMIWAHSDLWKNTSLIGRGSTGLFIAIMV